MSIQAASVPFPPAPEIGDSYSIWTFDGVYWMLSEGDLQAGDVTWDNLKRKPQSITDLGVDNTIDSDTYQSAKGIESDKATVSWSKNK